MNNYNNPLIFSVIFFVVIVLFFYLFEIGYTIKIGRENGKDKIIRKFNWKIPIAYTLIFWSIVQCMYCNESLETCKKSVDSLSRQKIGTTNWN